MTQYCVLSSQITSVGYVGNVICLKFAQESFQALFEKELVKNMHQTVVLKVVGSNQAWQMSNLINSDGRVSVS